MGGYAALALLQGAPQVIEALVLADTRATADSPEGRANRRNMLALVDREGPSGVAREMMPKLLGKTTHELNSGIEAQVRRLIKQQSPVAIRGAIHRMMHRQDSTALLPHVTVPTLVIVGALPRRCLARPWSRSPVRDTCRTSSSPMHSTPR